MGSGAAAASGARTRWALGRRRARVTARAIVYFLVNRDLSGDVRSSSPPPAFLVQPMDSGRIPSVSGGWPIRCRVPAFLSRRCPAIRARWVGFGRFGAEFRRFSRVFAPCFRRVGWGLAELVAVTGVRRRLKHHLTAGIASQSGNPLPTEALRQPEDDCATTRATPPPFTTASRSTTPSPRAIKRLEVAMACAFGSARPAKWQI